MFLSPSLRLPQGRAPALRLDLMTSAWASEMLNNLQQASDEALEIFYSAFNVSGAGAGVGVGARAGAADGLGWGSVSEEGEGRKQFFFGDPSEYDLSDINGPRSQVRAALSSCDIPGRVATQCFAHAQARKTCRALLTSPHVVLDRAVVPLQEQRQGLHAGHRMD